MGRSLYNTNHMKINSSQLKNLLLVLLVGVTVFSVFRYLAEFKARLDLTHTLNQTKEQLASLEKQRQNLLRQIEKDIKEKEELMQQAVELKDNLRAGRKKISQLFGSLNREEEALGDLKARFSLLSQEVKALNQEKDKLVKENDLLKAKLGSASELKRAIKELKKQAQTVGIQIIKKADTQMTVEGNQGYVVKDGKTNLPARVKIEVTPASDKK